MIDEIVEQPGMVENEVIEVGRVEPTPPLQPVQTMDRVASVDVLRGVALLGILAMNIVDFGWPSDIYGDPTLTPGYGWGDMLVWLMTRIIFDTKMMTIFSMLFGAGLVLMTGRAEATGRSVSKIYYRRVFFLLIIGLVHAYLIWEGDILVIYAICGLALYPMRRFSGRTLVILGLALMLVMFPGWLLLRAGSRYVDRLAAKVAAGETLPEWQMDMAKSKDRDASKPDETQVKIEKTIQAYRKGYIANLKLRAATAFNSESKGLLFFFWWYILGRMVLGMGLMKLGVFSGERSIQFYQYSMLIGYGLGLPLVLGDIAVNWRFNFFHGQTTAYGLGGWWIGHELSGPLIALGHIGLVMLIYKAGTFAWLTRRLSAVGRMALTNYLMHSIVFTILFYGCGLGYFATIHRPGLMVLTAIMWTLQLAYSPLWLDRFQYGPAEWCWRSLTYSRRQPFVRERPTEQVTVPT